MEQDEKKKKLVYALAAYKQQIVSHSIQRTQLRQTIKKLKIAVFWLMVAFVSSATAAGVFLWRMSRREMVSRSRQAAAQQRINDLSSRVDVLTTQNGQTLTRLQAQEALIQELLKKTSTSSKKLLENMLHEPAQ